MSIAVNHHRQGQSLLEAILAIAVILVATISATTLIVSTISTGQISKDNIAAANLAREGVEVVRGIRDSNWMKQAQNIADSNGGLVKWDDTGSTTDGYQPLAGTGMAYYHLHFFPTSGWTLFSSSNQSASVYSVTNGTTSFQTDDCAGTTGWTCSKTSYQRLVTVTTTPDTALSTPLNPLVVTVVVSWTNHGDHSYSLTERLYDWR